MPIGRADPGARLRDDGLRTGHEAASAVPQALAVVTRLAGDRVADDEVVARDVREAAEVHTLPTSVAEERETNPFVRASNWEEFARLRAEKDSFGS